MKRLPNILSSGQWAEKLAETYLVSQGFQLIERNYRCKWGEIDLIMKHQQAMVFIEVRYRAQQQFGGSLASIDIHKQQRIVKATNYYLQTHPYTQQYACRFDVILLDGEPQKPTIRWISDAFRP